MSLRKIKPKYIAITLFAGLALLLPIALIHLTLLNLKSDLAHVLGVQRIRNEQFVSQTMREDCGVACIKMVDDEVGLHRPYDWYLKRIPPTSTGLSLKMIANWFDEEGFRTEAYKGRLGIVDDNDEIVIAWVSGDHFVVVDSFKPDAGYWVKDPAQGCFLVPKYLMTRWVSGYFLSIKRRPGKITPDQKGNKS